MGVAIIEEMGGLVGEERMGLREEQVKMVKKTEAEENRF